MRKQRIISFLLTLCMVFTLLPVSALAASVEDFTDVSAESWYYKDVDFVADKGYFKGMSETTFGPDLTMTRAMFVTVLSRFAKAKVDDTKSAFTDVPVNTWYTGAVTWAAERKIVEGRGNGIFDPDGAVTREEMCTIIDRYLTATGTDVRDNIKHDQLKDEDQISTWAKTAVDNCQSYGVIYGYPDGTFQPKATATRAHVAAILHRLQIIVRGGGSSSDNEGEDPIYYTIKLEAKPAEGGKAEGPNGKTTLSVKKNNTVELKATANTGYEFVKWYWVNGDTEYLLSTDAVYEHEAVGNKTIYALFELEENEKDVTVTVTSNDTAMGTVTGGGTKAKGSEFVLTATPNDGYHFVNWTEAGKAAVTANPYTLANVTEDRTLVGNFEENAPDMVTVNVVSLNTEWGTALVNGSVSAYVAKGTEVTAVATPASDDYYFVGWKTAADATTYVSTAATYKFAASSNVTLYAEFAEVTDLTFEAAANLTNYLNGKVGETTVSFPTEEIAYLSAINLQQIDDVAGKKAAEVSVTGRATLTTELVREVYTEAVAEAYVLYDILRAELDGATDTKAKLVAELKGIAKDVFDAVGYQPDTATLEAIAEEIYAKVVTIYREIANKTLDKGDFNKSGLSTTIKTYKEVKALTKQELKAVREAVATAVKTYNGDYAFDTAIISVGDKELFSIDVSNGFVLNYANKFQNSSIDLPSGKRVFVKDTAVALAKQMRASNTSSEWSSTVYFNGHVTMDLELKEAVAKSPAYDCTETFELTCALSVTDQTGTVQYKYENGKDYIKITMPEKVKKEYNEKVPAIWSKLINYVQNNPDILDRFDNASGEPVAVAFAMERSKSSGLNFNIDDIMANAGNYLTPDAVLGLVNGDDGAVLDILDKAIVDMVKPEDVDKILNDNEDIDFDLEDLVNDLTTEGALTEGEKEDLKDKIVEVATDAIKDAVKGTEYEDVIDDDMAEYIATSATNQVVTQKAEEMTQKAEEEKAEAEKKQAEAEQGEKLTQEQLDALMKALEEAQNNNAGDAEIEDLQKQISNKEQEKAEYAAAAEEAKAKADAAAATANRLQTGKEVFAENLSGAKENVQVSGSVGNFVEEIKKNDTVGDAINQIENNRALQELIKLYTQVDTYDELWTADLGKIAKAFKTERFDDMGNGLVEKVKGWLDQYALNIPASAKLEIGDYTISNADLQAVRNADSTKELREAVANLFDAISGLTLGDFEEGMDLTVYGGKYSYTVNLTIVK